MVTVLSTIVITSAFSVKCIEYEKSPIADQRFIAFILCCDSHPLSGVLIDQHWLGCLNFVKYWLRS